MKTVLVLLALVILSLIGWAQQAGTDERIAQLLDRETHDFRLKGLSVDRQSIRILDSSQLSSGAASFHLAGLQRTTRDEYLATVRCSSSAECLPFLVAFRCSGPVGASVHRPEVIRRAKPDAAVRRGDTARLEMTTTGAKLSFPVVCLEEGSVGEIIRARAIGNRRIFMAMVIGPRRVRGMEVSQ
jgi:hypothetical protein